MREVEVGYRYRLRTNEAQSQALQDVFDSCRFVWNQTLQRWSELWHHEKINLIYRDANRELTDWRSRFEWLAEQPSVPQQQVIRDLYKSIAAFFDRANPAGRPRPKRKSDGYATARWTLYGFGVSGSGLGVKQSDRLKVAVAGGRIPLRVVWSRPLPSKPSSVTILRDPAGRWWASFVCRVEVPEHRAAPTGQSTGLDVGLETFATVEDLRHDVANPRFLRVSAKAKRKADRHLARKRSGSRNRAKARRAKARVEAKLANQRADFHHKTSRALVAVYDRIGVEDLTVHNMFKRGKGPQRRNLNRSIMDAGWGQFQQILVWQAAKAGTEVVVCPARDSTQRCSCCGAIAKPRVELSDREFRCRSCGLVLGRDRNAARNLNPDRPGPGGGAEPSGQVQVGDDGDKTQVSADAQAA
jgi:putative transposase